jgi:VIT1/CCC1 family predicted Fe2+/Mn2+ transporter
VAETAQERASAVTSVLDATASEATQVKEAALKALAAVPGPDVKTTGRLWTILISGLVIALLIAVIGVLFSEKLDADADKVWGAGAAILTGLIGLFAPSPTTSSATE